MNHKEEKQTKVNKMLLNKQGQTQKMKTEISQLEDQDDVTKYGEFVSSYFAWLTLDRQKRRANQMENMTNDENAKR